MQLARITLLITAAVWLGYGAWLFFDPKGLTYMGYGLDNWSAIVEVQAMYGAAEFMLGVFTLLGVLNPKRYMHPALLLWAFIYSALVFGRTIGIIQWGGTFALHFGADALPWNYNPGAMFFLELPSATLFWISLYLTHDHPDLK